MLGKLVEMMIQANPGLAVAGWAVVAAMIFVPQVASLVYGLFGKSIVITAKPSPAVVEAIKQALAEVDARIVDELETDPRAERIRCQNVVTLIVVPQHFDANIGCSEGSVSADQSLAPRKIIPCLRPDADAGNLSVAGIRRHFKPNVADVGRTSRSRCDV